MTHAVVGGLCTVCMGVLVGGCAAVLEACAPHICVARRVREECVQAVSCCEVNIAPVAARRACDGCWFCVVVMVVVVCESEKNTAVCV